MSEDRTAEVRLDLEQSQDQAYMMAQAIAASRASVVPVQTDPPSNVDVPAMMVETIATTCVVGDILTVTAGNWNNDPTSYSQEWTSNDKGVGSSSTYTVQASDAGNTIACMVTATNGAGSTTVKSGTVTVAVARKS